MKHLMTCAVLGASFVAGCRAAPPPVGSDACGAIAGTLTYSGAPPAPVDRPLPAYLLRECGPVVQSEDLLVDPDTRGVRNVVVYVQGSPSTFGSERDGKAIGFDNSDAPIAKPTTIRIAHCRFDPHVTSVLAGTVIELVNGDACAHNFHLHSARSRAFNTLVPPGTATMRWVAEQPETVSVMCDLHAWERCWVRVQSNPFFAVTDAGGHFRIDRVPPGTYTLKAWHERLGVEPRDVIRVKVEAGRVTTAEFPPLQPK